MATRDEIQAALAKLDPKDDSQWTDDGLPLTSVVQKLANDPSVKRKDINDVAPGFSRENAGVQEPVQVQAAPAVDPVTGVIAGPVETEVETGEDVTDDQLKAALQARFAAAEKAVDDARQAHLEAQTALNKAIKAKDAAQLKLHSEFPPLTFSQNIQNHLKAQQAERERQMGYGSQLDAAMSGRRSRGWGRPNRGAIAR